MNSDMYGIDVDQPTKFSSTKLSENSTLNYNVEHISNVNENSPSYSTLINVEHSNFTTLPSTSAQSKASNTPDTIPKSIFKSKSTDKEPKERGRKK